MQEYVSARGDVEPARNAFTGMLYPYRSAVLTMRIYGGYI